MQKKKTRKMYFNFKRIHKKEVYQAFLAIYAHGGIELTNEELISFLARKLLIQGRDSFLIFVSSLQGQ